MTRLLTSAEAAQRLNVSKTTIHRWASDGTLPYAQKLDGLRGTYLFAAAVIDQAARLRQRRRASLGRATAGVT
jgi:excisionase family DNA binding protein